MNTKSVQINNKILLKDIDSYGSHISILQGVKGRFLSCLHWSTKYDETNLRMRYVEWAQQPGDLKENDYKDYEFNNFFDGLNTLKTENSEAFHKANSRHIAQILDAFYQNGEKIKSVFASYQKLSSDSPEFNIDAFIAATNAVLANGNKKLVSSDDIKVAIALQSAEASRFDLRIKNSMYEGFIWEIACAFWCHKYEAIPVINACLNALTGSVLFSGFWGFFFAGLLAELSLSVMGPALKGIWEKGSIESGIESFIESWNARISDDNSFHPFIESVIGAGYIAVSWLWLDKLQKAAKAGDYLHTMMEWGIKGFVLRYSTMHAFFTLKAELHKGAWLSARAIYDVSKAGVMGGVRGFIKNPLAEFSNQLQASFKLSEALSLLNFPFPVRDAYLYAWMASVPKTIIQSPEWLITCLWLARDAWEAVITNLSSFFMQVITHGLENPIGTFKYCYQRLDKILVAIIVGLLAYYNPQVIGHYFNSSNFNIA